MVGRYTVTSLKCTLGELAAKVDSSGIDERTQAIVLVPPLDDAIAKTSIDEYKKALTSLISKASTSKAKLIVTTIPLFEPELDGKVNQALAPYNAGIQEICSQQKVPLVDLAELMTSYLQKNPGSRLTLEDERLNPVGNLLMADAILPHLGTEQRITPELEAVWDDRGSYTYRYERSVYADVHLTPQGLKAYEEVHARYHKLGTGKIMEYGVDHLLHDDKADNSRRLEFVNTDWRAPEPVKHPIKLRGIPASANQIKTIDAYIKDHGIDLPTFYTQAFDVGLYILHSEDPLGRGVN